MAIPVRIIQMTVARDVDADGSIELTLVARVTQTQLTEEGDTLNAIRGMELVYLSHRPPAAPSPQTLIPLSPPAPAAPYRAKRRVLIAPASPTSPTDNTKL